MFKTIFEGYNLIGSYINEMEFEIERILIRFCNTIAENLEFLSRF